MKAELAQLPPDTKGAMMCSVVPKATSIMRNYIKRVSGLTTDVLTVNSPLPIKIGYGTPEALGTDRIAAVVGAVVLYGAPVVAVDLGTAVTVDVVDKNKTFLGGAILPGPETQALSLVQHTAQLPFVPADYPPEIGIDPESCIRFGIVQGTAGAIDYLIELIWKHIGQKTTVVFSGGHGELTAKLSKHQVKFEPSLIAIGLAACYREKLAL